MAIETQNIILRVIQKGNDKFNRDIDGTTKKVNGLGGAFGRLGDIIKGNLIARGIEGLAQAAGGLVRQTAALAIQSEQTRVSFETFLGSAEKATQVLEDLNKFSLSTPFTPDEVNQAGKALLAFGIEQEKLIPSLRAIGDLSAGTGKNFNELAVIYGKARVQGTLFAEDINQLTESGIPIIDEFAKQFGVSTSEVKKLGSEGKISFANLETAFQSLTGEGGKFFELTARQSKTVGGLISTLEGAFSTLLKNVGEAFLPLAREILPPLISALFKVVDVVKPLAADLSGGLSSAFIFIGEAMRPVITAGQRLFAAFGEIGNKIREVIPQGNVFAGVILTLSNTWTTLTNVLSRVLEFELVQKSLAGLVAIIVRIPAVFNGVLEAGKVFGSNLGSRFEVLGLQAERLTKQIEGVFSDSAAAEAEAISRRIEQLRSQRDGIGEAFTAGFDAVANAQLPEPDNTQVEAPYFRLGETAGQKFGEGLSKEAKKAAEKAAKESADAFRNIQDLRIDLISNDEERDLARAKLAAERTIAALVGTPEQIIIQTELISELLGRQVDFIIRQNSGKVKVADLLDRDEEAKPIVEAFAKQLGELYSKELNNNDPLKLDIEPQFDLAAYKANLAALKEELKPSLIEKFFGKDPAKDIGELFTAVGKLSETIQDPIDLAAFDEKIETSQEKLERLQLSQVEGAAELIAIEKNNLTELEAAKAEAAAKQEKREKSLAILTAATNVAQAVGTILSLYKEGLLKGIAGTVAVVGSIASVIGAVKAATLHDGTESVGDTKMNYTGGELRSDEMMAKLQKKERVVSVADNKQLLNWGVKNSELTKLVGLGLGKLEAPVYSINRKTFGDAADGRYTKDILRTNKALLKSNEKLNEQISRMGVSVNYDAKGLTVHQMRLKHKAQKFKKAI